MGDSPSGRRPHRAGRRAGRRRGPRLSGRHVEARPRVVNQWLRGKISASSDAGRCWANRPHIAGKSQRRLHRRAVEESARTDVSSLIARQGPLNRDEAKLLLDRGGPARAVIAAFQYARIRASTIPDVTAAALLGAGQAPTGWTRRARSGGGRRSSSCPRRRRRTSPADERAGGGDRDLQERSRVPGGRRAPPEDKPEIANRLGWLAKETGNVRASAATSPRPRRGHAARHLRNLAITIAVSLTAELERGPSDRRAAGPVQAGRRRRRAVAAVDGHARPRGLPSRIQHVRAVSHRAPRRADLRSGQDDRALPGCGRRRFDRLVCTQYGPENSFSVGASGAIFGLFGILFVASRRHMPVLDRRGRAILGQSGC